MFNTYRTINPMKTIKIYKTIKILNGIKPVHPENHAGRQMPLLQ